MTKEDGAGFFFKYMKEEEICATEVVFWFGSYSIV
jgi:hypothetical protein